MILILIHILILVLTWSDSERGATAIRAQKESQYQQIFKVFLSNKVVEMTNMHIHDQYDSVSIENIKNSHSSTLKVGLKEEEGDYFQSPWKK